jgi:hypothetical protein
MAVYDKKSLLDNRYQLLATSSIYTYDDDNLTSYAEFLRKFGRYLSKDGYVDSDTTVHRSSLKQKDNEKFNATTTTTTTTNTNTTSATNNLNTYKKQSRPTTETTLTELVKQNESRQKQHEKHMKLIQDQMIQSKQEEREFKRRENDVKKENRAIRHSMRELDVNISKKKLEAEKELAKNLQEKERIEIENAHLKENLTKKRTEQNIETIQRIKDKSRKDLTMCSELSTQYRIKMNELDVKHKEIDVLYETLQEKVRNKEEEEAKLKKEIAEIALALNMETKKIKNDLFNFEKNLTNEKEKQIKQDLDNELELEDKINKTSTHIKSFDLTRRRLSNEAVIAKSQIQVKKREAIRRINDTQNNLQQIYTKQRNLNELASISQQDKKGQEIIRKIEDVNERKKQLLLKKIKEKRAKSDEHEHIYSLKAFNKQNELQLKTHEEHLKHFQKIAQKDDDYENDLYKQVKESEFNRRKQEKELKELQDKLSQKKRENSQMVKHLLQKVYEEEQQLYNTIIREKAKLDKVIYLCIYIEREREKILRECFLDLIILLILIYLI